MAQTVPLFTAGELEAISRKLGEAMTGSQLSRLLPDAGIVDISTQSTKWKRIYEALAARQANDGRGNAVCRFIRVVLAPERFGSEPERFEEHREGLNLTLAFVGLELREDGKLYRATPTTSLTQAQERANALKAKLRERNVHPDVLVFCRAELLQKNYFHAVFEATKSIADKIRTKTCLTSDGAELVDEAFGVKSGMPPLAFNLLQSPTERSEHTVLAMLTKGMFGTFRNTTAHAPKVSWPTRGCARPTDAGFASSPTVGRRARDTGRADQPDLASARPPYARPVFLQDGNNKEFHVRTGNTTRLMDVQEAISYIAQHWKAAA